VGVLMVEMARLAKITPAEIPVTGASSRQAGCKIVIDHDNALPRPAKMKGAIDQSVL